MALLNLCNICRLCLDRCDPMINIYEVIDRNGVLIADVIKDLLQVKVCATDGYSHYVCNVCLGKVTDYRLFKDRCLHAMATYASMLYQKGCTFEINYPALVRSVPSRMDMDQTTSMPRNECTEQPIPNYSQEDATEYILPCQRRSGADLSSAKNSTIENSRQVNYGPVQLKQELASFNKETNTQDEQIVAKTPNEEEYVEYIVPSPSGQEIEMDFSPDKKPIEKYPHQGDSVRQVTVIYPEEVDEYIVPSPTRQELDSIPLKNTVTKETTKLQEKKAKTSFEEIIISSSSDLDFSCGSSDFSSSEDENLRKKKTRKRKAKSDNEGINASKKPTGAATNKKNDVLSDGNKQVSTLVTSHPRESSKEVPSTKQISSRNMTYYCNKCDGNFKSEAELNEHKLRHKLLKPLKCDNCYKKFPNRHELFQHNISQQCIIGIPYKGETIPKGSPIIVHDSIVSGTRSSLIVHDGSVSGTSDPQLTGTLKGFRVSRARVPCNDFPGPVKSKLSGPVDTQTNIFCATTSIASVTSSDASETAFPVASIHGSACITEVPVLLKKALSSACITEEGLSRTNDLKAAVSGSFVPIAAVCRTDSPVVSITKANIPGTDVSKSIVSGTDSLVVNITKPNISGTSVSKPADSETGLSANGVSVAIVSGTDASRTDESMDYDVVVPSSACSVSSESGSYVDVSALNEEECPTTSLDEKNPTKLLNSSLRNVRPKKKISTVKSLKSEIPLVSSDNQPKNMDPVDQKEEEKNEFHFHHGNAETEECPTTSLGEKNSTKLLNSSLRNVRPKISSVKSLQSNIPLVSSDEQLKNMNPVGQKEEEKNEFLCTECGKIFKHLPNLYNHMKTHGAKKEHCCKICKKTFLHKHHLMQHESTHDVSKLFRCPICSKTFKMDFLLTNHQEKIHGIIKRFECTVCGKSFKGKGGLEHHTRMKHEEKQIFQCDACGFKTPKKGILKRHLETHSSECHCRCDVCGKAFKRNSTLRRHYLIHSESRNFSCSICGKAFVQKGALVVHMKSHSDERAFSCDICEKKFKDKYSMMDHKETHGTELKYSCVVCSKKFAGRKQMMKHRNGHRVKPLNVQHTM